MALESATFVSSLDATNPPGTDKKKQGDDHLRLVKSVMKATFPNAGKAFYFPDAVVKSANFSILSTDMHKLFILDTSGGAIQGTLPSLALGDAGWSCVFWKTPQAAAAFIAPPSGTIASGGFSVSRARRSIPHTFFRAFWSGSDWFLERSINLPLGTVLDNPHRSSLPIGFEYAMGQTLASASTDYPEFFAANGNSGVVTDRQGRAAFGRTNMDGSDNSLLAGSGMTGTTRGSTGGAAKRSAAEVLASLPASFSHSGIVAGVTGGGVGAMVVSGIGTVQWAPNAFVGTGSGFALGVTLSGGTNATIEIPLPTVAVTNQGSTSVGGSNADLVTTPPGIVTDFIVVVE